MDSSSASWDGGITAISDLQLGKTYETTWDRCETLWTVGQTFRGNSKQSKPYDYPGCQELLPGKRGGWNMREECASLTEQGDGG